MPGKVHQRPSNFVARGFCKNQVARNKDGRPVQEDSPNAVMWCQLGAIVKSLVNSSLWQPYQNALREIIMNDDPITWNNKPERTQEQVVSAMRQTEDNLKTIIDWEEHLEPISGITDKDLGDLEY